MSSLLKKACAYCIYQERTHEEVRTKLKSWGADCDEAEETLAWLITENFINESRFARQFAGGKFRVKKWGKKKIAFELKSRGISPYCIQEALSEIDGEKYLATVQELAEKKAAALATEPDPFVVQKKVITYLLGKGYTFDEISHLFKT